MMFNWACKLLKFLIVLTTNKMFIRRGGGEGGVEDKVAVKC